MEGERGRGGKWWGGRKEGRKKGKNGGIKEGRKKSESVM